jgi:hypothetical protein
VLGNTVEHDPQIVKVELAPAHHEWQCAALVQANDA